MFRYKDANFCHGCGLELRQDRSRVRLWLIDRCKTCQTGDSRLPPGWIKCPACNRCGQRLPLSQTHSLRTWDRKPRESQMHTQSRRKPPSMEQSRRCATPAYYRAGMLDIKPLSRRVKDRYCSKRLNISANSLNSGEEDGVWTHVPEEVRQAVFTGSSPTMPDMPVLCRDMLQHIMDGTMLGSTALDYRSAIIAQGGIDYVTEEMIRLIPTEILELRDAPIGLKELELIRNLPQQSTLWPRQAGYLMYITDEREKNYVRFYVGQSKNVQNRIIWGHVYSVLGGLKQSLPYFLVWLGAGRRALSFIKLWGVAHEESDEMWCKLRQNLMELLFCFAFDTCHGEHVHGGALNGRFSGFGLNILSPLYQGVPVEDWLKGAARRKLQDSLDPQIRYYSSFRIQNEQRQLEWQLANLWTRTDFVTALSDCIGENQAKELLGRDSIETYGLSEEAMFLVGDKFIGSLSASLAFVVGHGYNLHDSEGDIETDESSIRLPWALHGSGFDEDNVLVWTWNFEPFGSTSSEDLETCCASDIKRQNMHGAMLTAAENLRMVVMCGPLAEKQIYENFGKPPQLQLCFRGHKFRVFLGSIGSHSKQAVFFSAPELPTKLWRPSIGNINRTCELIRFTTFLLKMENIRPFYMEDKPALDRIIAQRALEKVGRPLMTVETLGSDLRLWLARKGFDRLEDILELEKRAGSLNLGLVLLLEALPRQGGISEVPRKKNIKSSEDQKPGKVNYGIKVTSAIQFCKDLFAKRELAWTQAINNRSALSSPAAPCKSWNELPLFNGIERGYNGLVTEIGSDLPNPAELNVSTDEFAATSNGLSERNAASLKSAPFRRSHSRIVWFEEASTFHFTKYDLWVETQNHHSAVERISFALCIIYLPKHLDVGDGKLKAAIEICTAEDSLSNYAKDASANDPGKRIRFRIQGQTSKGEPFDFFPRGGGIQATMRANTLYDVLHFKSRDQIMQTPRRVYWANGGMRFTADR